ncbi:hypothetical protein Mal15_22010 [Stieleria maiorica]|uniref:Uncharacterized protein n=1 Tax=Stieleria maiorica TaxID=2795974 RepID=A0A5B9MBM9_9BACT|nr:hypothetical protein [Stieleria maiorica]QEF98153.1 hypothetical protein Mal15_22010 [Stieleria maiorica]
MSLHDAISELNDIIFDTDGFAETIEYWPLGVEANKFEVDAVVDWSDEEGSNQVRGDGRSSLNADKGREVRRTAIIELPIERVDDSGATVRLSVSESGKDRIVVTEGDSQFKLRVKRIIGHDEAVQTVLATRSTEYQAGKRFERKG